MTRHQQLTHPEYVEGCFGCKAGSIMLSPAVELRVQGDGTYRTQRIHGSLAGDMAAYKRLRAEGHQPPHIRGSAFLERQADHPFEIARGKVYRGAAGTAFKEAIDMLADHGVDPTTPQDTPKPVEV